MSKLLTKKKISQHIGYGHGRVNMTYTKASSFVVHDTMVTAPHLIPELMMLVCKVMQGLPGGMTYEEILKAINKLDPPPLYSFSLIEIIGIMVGEGMLFPSSVTNGQTWFHLHNPDFAISGDDTHETQTTTTMKAEEC